MTMNGQIVRLTLQGFLAEVAPSNLQPGDRFDVSFTIPVLNASISEPVVMIKLYSQWGEQNRASSPTVTNAEKDPQGSTPVGPNLTSGSPKAEGRPVVHLIEVHFQSLGLTARSAITQFVRATGKPA